MFKSLHMTRSKSMKNVKISSPISTDQPSVPQMDQSLVSNGQTNTSTITKDFFTPRTTPMNDVILITKFDFKAERKHELTIGVGEALKLVERKGNGWILVKPVGRISEPGLIPASYVRIIRLNQEASNLNLDEKWLSTRGENEENSSTSPKHKTFESVSSYSSSNKTSSSVKYPSSDTSVSSSTEEHFSYQSTSTDSRSTSPNSSVSGISINELIPISGLVRNASNHNGRYWYRVDIIMNNGKKRYLCRYYQDFYKLHCSIVQHLKTQSNDADEEFEESINKLPTLPDPIPRPDLQTLSSILLQRCQSLNVYMFKVVQNKHKLDYLNILNDWIQPRLGDIETKTDEIMTNEQIEEILQPMPTNIKKSPRKLPKKEEEEQVTTIPLKSTRTSISSSYGNTISQINENSKFQQPVSSRSSTRSSISSTRTKDPNESQLTDKISKVVTRNKPSLSISTSVTPPLPAPTPSSFGFQRSPSISSFTTLNSGPPSPVIWNSPTFTNNGNWRKQERSNSTPTIHEGEEKTFDSWLDSPVEPLFRTKDEPSSPIKTTSLSSSSVPKKRNASLPNLPICQTKPEVEFYKAKIYCNDDIFALRIKNDLELEQLKLSILTRLECDTSSTFVKLYYKNHAKNYFSPLVDEMDLRNALEQPKIGIKVHLFTNEAEKI